MLDDITTSDVVSAYRMAKIDGWYMHSLDLEEVRDFEQDFAKKITCIQKRVNEFLQGKVPKAKELGGWKLETKKSEAKKPSDMSSQVLFSDLGHRAETEKLDCLQFRLLAQPTILFHILSALWIAKVGYKYDQNLGKYSYGNRLRPIDRNEKKPGKDKAGNFKYYIKMFKGWRDAALRHVLKHLKDLGENVTVVTADAHAFYHRLKPNFLLNEEYLKMANVGLEDSMEKPLTKVLIDAINIWSKETPLTTGLPVGLPASAVIANAALLEFDSTMHDDVQPLFYGRYVDDIILVFRWIKEWSTLDDIWQWVAARTSSKVITYEQEPQSESNDKNKEEPPSKCLYFAPQKYQNDLTLSQIVFKGSKCKAFFLDTKTGIPLAETFKEQLRNLSSEFRLLPERAGDEVKIRNKIRHLLPEDGNVADNIRKIKSQEFRRSDFMALLKELETIEKVIPSALWKGQRNEFYSAFTESLMNWRLFPDFEKYIPRVIALMTRNGDFDAIEKLVLKIRRLNVLMEKIFAHFQISGLGSDMSGDKLSYWREPLFKSIQLAIQSNIKMGLLATHEYQRGYWKLSKDLDFQKVGFSLVDYEEAFENYSRAFLIHDISNEKLASFVQRREMRSLAAVSMLESSRPMECMPEADTGRYFDDKEHYTLASKLQCAICGNRSTIEDGVFYGLLFPTRPISVRDIFQMSDNRIIPDDAKRIIKAYRGYEISDAVKRTLETLMPVQGQCSGDSLSIPRKIVVADKHRPDVAVAIMSLRTEEDAICLEMKTEASPNLLERYKAIIQLVNEVLKKREHPQYIVFHELCLPPRWFAQIAERCFRSGVSVISGVDYIMDKCAERAGFNTCSNEVWMSLVSLFDDFPVQVFLSEKKNRFAHAEANELMTKYGFSIANMSAYEKEHAIIMHGDFSYSVLICSELTEMTKRCRLIGRIDALFVVSWNQDINTFDTLVKAAASDIHCYVIVCNNNKYGDSRVRVPKKKEWARDVVEVRGGEDPYFVIGKLEIGKLRKFQSYNNPNLIDDAEFKPLPMGFDIDKDRKVDV